MTQTVTISSSRNSSRITFFSPEPEDVSKTISYYSVKLEAKSLEATTKIYAIEETQIADLFQDMAECRYGWSGVKSAQSVEGDLSIECIFASRGEITMTVRLYSSPASNWEVCCPIYIDLGQMGTISKEILRFFRVS